MCGLEACEAKLQTSINHKHMVLLIKRYSLQHGELVILCSWITTSCVRSQRRWACVQARVCVSWQHCAHYQEKAALFQNAQLQLVASRLPTLILSSKGLILSPPKASLWLFYFSITQAPAVTALTSVPALWNTSLHLQRHFLTRLHLQRMLTHININTHILVYWSAL